MTKKPATTIYWREGCAWCASLFKGIEEQEIPVIAVNIHENPTGLTKVREITGGSATVPTVTIGNRAMVNPDITQIMAVLHQEQPEDLPDNWEPKQPNKIQKLFLKLLGAETD